MGVGIKTEYYRLSGEALAALNLGCSCSSCDVNCISHNHLQFINDYYNNIVSALKGAEKLSIPSIPHSALRNFWNDELDELKSKSIFWHGVWLNAGRPSSGLIHQIKASCKLKYKSAIRHAIYEHENAHNDELFNHFMNKRIPEFRKNSCSGKFHQNDTKDVYINGSKSWSCRTLSPTISVLFYSLLSLYSV